MIDEFERARPLNLDNNFHSSNLAEGTDRRSVLQAAAHTSSRAYSQSLAEQGVLANLAIVDGTESKEKVAAKEPSFGKLDLNQSIDLIKTAGSFSGTTVLKRFDSKAGSKFEEPEKLSKDIPVVFVAGIEAGSLGMLERHDKSGKDIVVPFIAGKLEEAAIPKQDVLVLNDAAAKAIADPQAKKGSLGTFDLIALSKDSDKVPASKSELDQVVADKLKSFASRPEVVEKAERVKEGKDAVTPVYVPKPDAQFGYRRTDRSADELNKLRTHFNDEAKKNWQLAESVKPGSPKAAELIKNVLADAQTEKARLEAQAKSETNSDKIALQDRIISEASNPKFAQQYLQHRFAMKAYAAEMMAANPDMEGALAGTRHVINAGHDPMHGSTTPGFGKFPWSKGMEEFDFNRETSAIQGDIIEYAGGVPIYVYQEELFKTNPETQEMSGLGAAMAAHHADTEIANHVDDDKGIPAGTMTMVDTQSGGQQSMQLGLWVSQAKNAISGEPTKGVRDLRDRGVQRASHGGTLVLNEILTTSAKDRARLMDPHELAKLQFGVVLGIDQYLHPPSQLKMDAEKAADKTNATTWDQYWKKQAKSSIPALSLVYPRVK